MHRLMPHPASPPRTVTAVTASIVGDVLRFAVEGGESLLVPEAAAAVRTDALWRTTCFEMFVRAAGEEGYREFNFSPSGAWAAYAFDGYRAGMRPLGLVAAPAIGREGDCWAIVLDEALPAGPASVGISAVIEERDGTKSFWALRHPPGVPDFHHPDCFALELPAPDTP